MFFEEGRNCWKVAKVHRAAFLIDGEDYFKTFADACERAQRTVFIIGWDIDSRIRLRRGGPEKQESLGQFVDRLACENSALNIYILEWDFAMLYALERESFPSLSFGWQRHKRVHFALDDQHPLGASHHQKIVVVDDCLAFVGGLDLASHRWDTSEHLPEHKDRCDNQTAYEPFHDVQMIVEGSAAEELGRLCRSRWQRATGERLSASEQTGESPWPTGLAPELENAHVAILRTEPGHNNSEPVCEIENFYRDAIARAKTSIYIENQYLASRTVKQALESALERETGPEILLLLPRECSGWLEQETMGRLRQGLVQALRAKDRHGRFRVCYPERSDLGTAMINVHSKVLIVDDMLLTVGSANLNNRSMSFDTECNLALSAQDQPHAAEAIAGLRNRLLAEHLGTTSQKVAEHQTASGSLLSTVSALTKDLRFLDDLPIPPGDVEDNFMAQKVVDPERPVSLPDLLEHFGYETGKPDAGGKVGRKVGRKAWVFAILLVAALVMAILWRWSPLGQWLDKDTLLASATSLRESTLAIPIVLVIYVIGSCLMCPVTLLILVTVLSFGSYLGFVLAWVGSLLGGLASYLIGRWLGRDAVRRLAGENLNRLNRKLARRGWLTIAVLRIVPVAPFTIVNMVAGSSQISLSAFVRGTALGMAPGILTIAIFKKGVQRALLNPDWLSAVLALVALVFYTMLVIGAKRALSHNSDNN